MGLSMEEDDSGKRFPHCRADLEDHRGSISTALGLRPLTAAETEALFASVFANAPNVPLLSEHVLGVAAGSPRESMALAQHLLDRQRVRFVDGVFRLPTELALQDLPANIEDALLAQLASLSPLAASLAQTQALALDGAWSRADYAEIAGASSAHLVDGRERSQQLRVTRARTHHDRGAHVLRQKTGHRIARKG